VQHPRPREIKANATYDRIRGLSYLSLGAQARDVELVKKVPPNPISRIFQSPKQLFVRKSYRFGADGSTVARKYLWSEYEILSKLRHPNIVQYVDFEYKERNGKCSASIYMEYCEGGDLSQYALRDDIPGKQISENQFWEIFYQVTSALLYCHAGLRTDENGVTVDSSWNGPILHRDIKPANGM
jgi:serine/threonine protein kinase